MVNEITVTIKGRASYERWTIYRWIMDFKEILESEYGVSIKVTVIDGEEELPVIFIDGLLIETYLYEEGYVFEALKKALDRFFLGLRGSNYSCPI